MKVILSLSSRKVDVHMRKVQCIKAIRELGQLGLREAKEIIDDVMDNATNREINVIAGAQVNPRFHFKILNDMGIDVKSPAKEQHYIRDTQHIAIRAIKAGDYAYAAELVKCLSSLAHLSGVVVLMDEEKESDWVMPKGSL